MSAAEISLLVNFSSTDKYFCLKMLRGVTALIIQEWTEAQTGNDLFYASAVEKALQARISYSLTSSLLDLPTL